MKHNVALITAAIWGSSAIAISVGLYYTHDIKCLWFLIIPSLMQVNTKAEG